MKQKHKQKFTDEELLQQYSLMPNMNLLATYFQVPVVTIWRRSKKLNLIFKRIGSANKIKLEEILLGNHPQYDTTKLKNRLLKEEILENKCEICGINSWNEKSLILHLDHIDGNSHNHLLKNLRLLCPNCHSQTETWCGKNK